MAAIVYKWFLTSLVSFFHPFFVSVTEMNHNAKDKTLEISCKLFADDFEKGLEQVYKTPVDITNPKDKKQTEQYISDYLKKHLQLKIDGKAVSIEYLGFEKEGEAAWCYLQVSNVSSVKKIEITDKILHETFNTQINIIHVTVNGERKSNRLNYPDATVEVSF
jgi:hypothetical protein